MEFFDSMAARGQVERAAAICVFHGELLKAIELLSKEATRLQRGLCACVYVV